MLDAILQDLRYALRQWRKSPAFTLTAILTLAFGIAATTAVFSVVEGVLLRPLPFPDPGALVTLGDIIEGAPESSDTPGVTATGVRTYMRDTRAFAGLSAYQSTTYELSGLGDAERINGARLTASTFKTIGVSPMLGRGFTDAEDEGAQLVTVLSYPMWQNRFQGDPHIIGRSLQLDRKPYEIIGVMPRDFEYPLIPGQLNRSELWVPMSFTQAQLVQGAGAWSYYVVGRLASGVTPAQAQQDAMSAAQEIMRNFPPALSTRKIHPVVKALDEATVAQARPLVRSLFFAVIVVLFIASANLAGLLLVRVIRRQREIAVRIALGASRLAVLRQSLIEALLLSMSGGLLGLILAAIALRVGVDLLPETLPRAGSIGLDWQVIAFAFALALLTGIFCGSIPAFAAARIGINQTLKETGRSLSGGHARIRSALVVAELAVALVMLIAAGLLLHSFEKMRSIGLGFDAGNTLTASFSLPREQYSRQADIDSFYLRLRTQLEALPGVQAFGATSLLPAAHAEFGGTFTPEGYVPAENAGLNIAWIPQVTGNYFQAQGIPILRGRAFTVDDDRDGAPLVAIVNRTLAEHYWPEQDAIGKRLHRGPKEANLPWLTVVGEIGEVKQIAADAPTDEQIYVPTSQTRSAAGNFAPPGMLTGLSGTLVLRGTLPPEQMSNALRQIVRSIDPQLPLSHLQPMQDVVSAGQAPRRFNTVLMTAFAGAAALLALLGIYSVVAFSTMLRTQEMAIRLALGAPPSSVVRLILVSGAKLGLAGCALGGIASIFATRLLRSFVFQVDALDPPVLVVAGAAILLIALAASVVPARRAAAVDPLRALRAE